MTLDLKISDTTLRDGEQAPGFAMRVDEKVRMGKQLEKLGVDIIEAGFPAASPEDIEAIQILAQDCNKAQICAIARCHEKDIEKAIISLQKAKKPRITLFIATSDIHLKFKLKMTQSEVVDRALKSIALVKSFTPNISFAIEDATRTEPQFIKEIVEMAIDSAVDTITIADTVGYCFPKEYGAWFKYLKTEARGIEKVILSAHCHNDLGLAVANSIEAVFEGARQVECTLLGIGERAGNAALEEIVMALKVKNDLISVKTNIVTKQIFLSCQMLSEILEIPIPYNKAIVGNNAFTHGSGIHQHGIVEHRETYEIMKPEEIGIEYKPIFLSRHSGRKGLREYLRDLNIDISDEDLEIVFQKFKDLTAKKKDISKEDILNLLFF